MISDVDLLSEPDFIPVPQTRALFNEEALMSAEPPGISTPVTGVLMLVTFISCWVQAGFFAALFLVSLSIMLTALYVLSTGRASWARIPSRNIAFIALGGSLLLAFLCKVVAG